MHVNGWFLSQYFKPLLNRLFLCLYTNCNLIFKFHLHGSKILGGTIQFEWAWSLIVLQKLHSSPLRKVRELGSLHYYSMMKISGRKGVCSETSSARTSAVDAALSFMLAMDRKNLMTFFVFASHKYPREIWVIELFISNEGHKTQLKHSSLK